jgi:CDP-glucose 4,6-dehydratase
MNLFDNHYKGKTVLVTGHTGFKGSWLSIWLNELGANVIGYALDPYTDKDNFVLSNMSSKMIDIRADIRNQVKLHEVFSQYQPDIVFHLAAQPLVRESYDFPVETYEINVMGTINVLEEIRKCDNTKIGIMITTDKVYENKEQIWGYKETDPLGGYDPYSSSKAAAEIAISSWRNSFMNIEEYEKHGKAIASVRAGNVIGGGDWAKDRIIPDCIRSIESNEDIEIRSPNATRPWQHVLEPLYGYLLLGYRMFCDPKKYSESWNFGPSFESITTVWEVVSLLAKEFKYNKFFDVSTKEKLHEANLLSLDITKTRYRLNWTPILDINMAIQMTSVWYKNYYKDPPIKICIEQIKQYMELL